MIVVRKVQMLRWIVVAKSVASVSESNTADD